MRPTASIDRLVRAITRAGVNASAADVSPPSLRGTPWPASLPSPTAWGTWNAVGSAGTSRIPRAIRLYGRPSGIDAPCARDSIDAEEQAGPVGMA